MRLDRPLSEGEAQIALRQIGFHVQESEGRPGLYDLSHPQVGGTCTMTTEQLCSFAAGAATGDQIARGLPSRIPS